MTRFRTALAALAMTAAPHLAAAAAWPLPKGDGQVIVNAFASDSKKGFDAKGDTIDINDYKKSELNLYSEYGFTNSLTGIFATQLHEVKVQNGGDTSGLGYTELGGRLRLAQPKGGAISVQATARIPGSTDEKGPAQIGSSDPEYDVRMLIGQGFRLGQHDAFVDAQAGYRIRADDPPNEYRLDLTAGVRLQPKLLVMAQSFNVWSDGAGRGVFTRYNYHNLQLSAAYDVTDAWTLQAGVMGALAGENSLKERGAFLAVWRKF